MHKDFGKGAIACGADGLIIECHPEPEKSVSDARQALSLEDMVHLVDSLKPVAKAVGRSISDVGASVSPAPIFLLLKFRLRA